MLELYHALISTCSQKIRLLLAEKQLDWASRPITLSEGEQLSPEYLINPNGVVPTLVDGGGAVTDSSVINEYLDDVYPAIPMRRLGRAARGRPAGSEPRELPATTTKIDDPSGRINR